MEITKITLNGKEYEVVDKAARDVIYKISEPYLPFPTIHKDYIDS